MGKAVKPKPPDADAVQRDMVSEMLRRLGAAADAIKPVEDMLYDALLLHWKKNKKPPTIQELIAGSGVSGVNIHHHLRKLQAAGRLLKPKKGFYVPVVEA